MQLVSDFQTPDLFRPPVLNGAGDTPMGAAIAGGLEMIRQRKQAYKANGIPYYRPWVFLITDGAPTDEWTTAADMVREGEASKGFSFFAVGVQHADMDILRQIAVRTPLRMAGLQFRDLFVWLSSSLSSVSRSGIGQEVPLLPPGWARA